MIIIKGGCGTRHPLSWNITRPKGNNNYVLLLLRTPGLFNIEGTKFIANPGDAILIAPHYGYSQNCYGCEYIDDWLHFNPDETTRIPDILPVNTPIKIYDHETCSDLIRLLLWEEAYSDQEFVQENMSSIAAVLMNHLVSAFNQNEKVETASPYMERLKNLRFKIKDTLMEQHDIPTHAKELGISCSHFQYLYSNLFGISFQQDLIRMRIENAKFLLQSSNMTMSQIAELCGYNNEVHFFRQFKKVIGTTPAKYRKHQLSILIL